MFTVNQCSWRGLARIPFGSGINEIVEDSFKLLRFWGQISSMSPTRNRVGFLPGNQRIANDAMILARQKRKQCVKANLFLYDISERANSEIINIFVKLCLILGSASRWCCGNNLGPIVMFYRHIWLWIGTCYYRQHLYGETCKTNNNSLPMA